MSEEQRLELGVLDHDGSVVVSCTPVGLCRWVEEEQEEQEEQGEPLGWVFWRRPGQWRERRWRWRWECDQRDLCPTLGMLADDVGCAGPLGRALCAVLDHARCSEHGARLVYPRDEARKRVPQGGTCPRERDRCT